jgi:hypothetical protein
MIRTNNTIELLDRTVPSDEAVVAPDAPAFSLRVAGVYQDRVTREWAIWTCRRATRLAGEGSIQSTWYSASSLGEPAFLAEAVLATTVADVILVSVYAADELPLDLYVWIDAWLPRRPLRVGALRALVGVAEPRQPQSVRTLDYLQAVARKAQLDFIPQERQLLVLPGDLDAERDSTGNDGPW